MTPQATLRARFSELAESLGLDFTARRQGGKFYFSVRGGWKATEKFMQNTFPEAWVTSAAGPLTVYGLPIPEVKRVLSKVQVEPAWLEHNRSVAEKIARTIRADGAFDLLPILADALEEGGCTNTEILSHCRESAKHKQTCWVIELLLGPDRKRRGVARPE